MTAAVLFPGDVVGEGVGPVRCSGRRPNGRICATLLGWPPIGSRLVRRLDLDDGERLSACERGLVAFRCPGCKSVSIFRIERVA